MLNISGNNIITLTRGDTFSAPLFLNVGTELRPIRHVLTDDEEIRLGLMEANELYENKLLEKVFTKDNLDENQDVLISFVRCDTINLLAGTYYYEIKLINIKTGEVNTVVNKTKFVLVN